MTKKRKNILIGIGLFFGIIFGFNIYTFIGLKNHPGYTYGTIIKNWESGKNKHDYSRYEYKVDGQIFQGRQGYEFSINSTVVIIYDKNNPKYSMIVNYPIYLIDENGNSKDIKPEFVTYSWWDYLPGDNISDLWK